MPSDYPQTSVPYDGWALPDLHDPVVLGPGFGSMEDSAAAYAKVAEALETAAGDLRAVMTASQVAHEGEAADASRRHIGRIAAAGDAGVAQAKLAMYALQEQASYYFRARLDMQAAAAVAATVTPVNAGEAIMDPRHTRLNADLDAARTIAVDAAHLYQNNSNHNLDKGFQAFAPPPAAAADSSVIAASPSPGWGASGVGAGMHGYGWTGSPPVDMAGVGGSAGAGGGTFAGPTFAGPAFAGAGAGAGVGAGAVPSGADPTDGRTDPRGGAVPGTPAGAAGAGIGRTPGLNGDGAGPGGAIGSRPLPGEGDRRPGRVPALPASTGAGPAGPASTSPQSGRPLGAAVPDGPSAGSGWVPGQPWSSRGSGPGVPGGGHVRGGAASGGGHASGGTGPGGGHARGGGPGGGYASGGTGPGGGYASGGVGSGGGYASGGNGPGGRPPAGAGPDGRPGVVHPTSPGVSEPGARGASPQRATGLGHLPFMAGGGAGGQSQGTTHPRPPWLVVDDPDSIWLSGLPPHGPAVIEP